MAGASSIHDSSSRRDHLIGFGIQAAMLSSGLLFPGVLVASSGHRWQYWRGILEETIESSPSSTTEMAHTERESRLSITAAQEASTRTANSPEPALSDDLTGNSHQAPDLRRTMSDDEVTRNDTSIGCLVTSAGLQRLMGTSEMNLYTGNSAMGEARQHLGNVFNVNINVQQLNITRRNSEGSLNAARTRIQCA